MNVSKLSAIANRLLQLALEVEDGYHLGSDTLRLISQEITSAIGTHTKPVQAPVLIEDCWAHLKGMTGNLSPPPSPDCKSNKKVSFNLD
jgi:hypothetical protein